MTANRTSGSLEFFGEESKSVNTLLQAAQQKLADARKRLMVSSFEVRLTELQSRKANLEQSLSNNANEQALTRSRITGVSSRLDELPDRKLANNTDTNSAYEQTKSEFYRLRVRRGELLVKYTPAHPLVREIDRQIESAESILSQASQTDSFGAASPVRQELELGLLKDETLVETLEAQRRELLSQLEQTGTEMVDLIGAQAEIDELNRQVEQHRKNLVLTTERLEEARIDQALAKEKISNVNPVQPPTLDHKPIAPRKSLVLGLGLVAAAFAAAASVLLRELAGRWLRAQSV